MPFGYILRRLGFLVAVLWTAATINFWLPKLTPRDPVEQQVTMKIATMGLSSEGAQEMIKSRKRLFGLDEPLWMQYLKYLKNMFTFNLGFSIQKYPKQVNEIIAETLPWTLGFLGVATILAFLIGTLLGAIIGWSDAPDFLNVLIPPLGMFSAIPPFVLALLLIYLLAFKAELFPLRGAYGMATTVDWLDPSFWLEIIHHATLPALSLLLVTVGSWALGMRSMMVTVEGADYITFAEAKGLKGARIFFRYAFRNALLPQVTALAMRLGAIVSGATLVEVMFGYPGIGKRLSAAIAAFDYYVIYGIVYLLVMGIALAMFAVDMIYPLLDPRISYQEGT